MSRSSVVRKLRPIGRDPIYGSKLISKLINGIMMHGNKRGASRIVYSAIRRNMDFINSEYIVAHDNKSSSDGARVIWFMESILGKIAPSLEVRSKRIGGSNYQIPYPVSQRRALTLSIRWLVNGARSRSERTMIVRLASEMKDAISEKGEAIKKRDSVRRVAEANKMFAHHATQVSE